jgi:hypothetical protein
MRHVLIGATAVAALLASSAVIAQAPDKTEAPPGARSEGKAGKGSAHEPQGARPSVQPGGASSDKAAPQQGAQGPSGDHRETARGQAERGPEKGAQPEKGRHRAQDQEERRAPQRTTQDKGEAPEKGQALKKGPESAQDRAQQPAKEKAVKEKAAPKEQMTQGPSERREGTKQPGAKTGAQPASRVQVSEQDRTRVRDVLFKQKVERVKVNVSLTVGTRVPRSVRVRPLPASIIEIVPAYRGYSFFVVEDTILIVDPATYVIVDVIESPGRRAETPGRPVLQLSAEQMRFIFEHVPKDRRADVRVRLALGAEIPRSVELLSFPRDVTVEVPAVEPFRYIVVDEDVVIVDPRDFSIALIISG